MLCIPSEMPKDSHAFPDQPTRICPRKSLFFWVGSRAVKEWTKPNDCSRMAIPHNCSLWCSGTMAIRISRRSNTYNARNNRLTSRYLFLPHIDFGFCITDLRLHFMAFPLSKKSNPAKDCSWNYNQDSSDHLSKYHSDVHYYTIICSLILNGRGSSRSSHYY